MTELVGQPESWLCVDCGMDTGPGLPGRIELAENIEAGGECIATFHEGGGLHRAGSHLAASRCAERVPMSGA